ncbi:MAG: prepilin-type N-terminal cleavage/methylation domain-containing protein [Thiobacillus sp.]|nr:prepilin-type N-terminal cleavage/methylation domain-containing protein [Thiobacillus sp.]
MIKTARGFTLIEMAIVLIIITILIGGLAVPLSAQIQARRIAETRKTMEEAREAILGYAMTHLAVTPGKRYLPCPDQNGNGTEDRILNNPANGCATDHGWLPWVTLGTASQDAWGNRLLYAVNVDFAHGTDGFSTNTPLATTASFGVCSTHTCGAPNIASNVAFIVMSHGANGWGALNVNGNSLAAPTGLDEVENVDADATYISRIPTQVGAASGEFDDILVWVSDSLLKARVCPTGSDCSP